MCATDVDICTSVVSIIKYGANEKVVRAFGNLKDYETEEIAFEDLEKYTTGSAASNGDTIFVKIYLPLEELKRGLTIIDTPGVGGMDPRHAALTRMFLQNVDVALFMTDVDAPLTTTELAFYRDEVIPNSSSHAVIVNKTDLMSSNEVDEIVEDTRVKIREYCGMDDPEIIAVSAAAEAFPDYELGESNFPAVRALIARMSETRRDILFNSFVERIAELIADTRASIESQIASIDCDNTERITTLEQLKSETDRRLLAISDPSSEFRKNIDSIIAAEREHCFMALNRHCVKLQGETLNMLLENPAAHHSETGGVWLGKELNKQLNTISRELTHSLNATFERIAGMPEFEGMLSYTAENVDDPIVERYVNLDIPLHRRLMPLTSGLGIYALGSCLLTAIVPVVGGMIAAGGAAYVAYQNNRETERSIKDSKLIEAYQPQIGIAFSDMRTFVDSRFREFRDAWIGVITERIKSLRSTLQETLIQINELKKNLKNAERDKLILKGKLVVIEGAINDLKNIKGR